MKKFKAILTIRLKMVFRDKMSLFFAFLFPVMLTSIFGLIIKSSDNISNITLNVYKVDNSKQTEQMLETLKVSETFKINEVSNIDQGLKDIEEGKSKILISISSEKQPSEIKAYYGLNGLNDYNQIIKPVLSGIIESLNTAGMKIEPKYIFAETQVSKSKIDSNVVLINGFIIQSLVLYVIIGASRVLAEEKEKNLLKRLAITNLKKTEYILAYMLSFLIIGMLQTITLVVMCKYLFGVNFYNIELLLLITVLLNILISMMGIFVGIVSRSANASTGLSQIIGFPLVILAGAWFPISLLPKTVQHISQYSPITAARVLLDQVSAVQTAEVNTRDLTILISSIVIFTVLSLATFKFRKG